MSSLLVFLFVWGVYLITPVLIDGADSVMRLSAVLKDRVTRKKAEEPAEIGDWPMMTIIIPAHNESEVIDRCLTSVKMQDYPSNRLEIIVVDDGSTDDTAEKVDAHVEGEGSGRPMWVRSRRLEVGKFEGKLALIKGTHGGKSAALNAGIAASSGEIIVNIDSDVVLTPDAARSIALAFLNNPRMDAATGNVQIDWEILEARDDEGNIIVDEHGDIVPRRLRLFERLLAKAQFLEYLASFDLGRRSQALTGTVYTLAGACTAFRRSVIARGVEYNSETVSEDTALTFELHRRGATIGFIPEANVHLEPVIDLDSLYGQRVRWARGQLEVCGLNDDLIGNRESKLGRLELPRMLLYDHTFAFPRLIWAPLFLCFFLVGYSWQTIFFALGAMYLFYVVIELVHAYASYVVADDFVRSRVGACRWAIIAMPAYRFIVFHYRFSGFLVTLKDKQQWTASGPLETARRDWDRIQRRLSISPALWSGVVRAARTYGVFTLTVAAFTAELLHRLQHLGRRG